MFSKEELTVPGSGPAWIRVLHTVYTEIPGRQGWPGSLGLRVNPKPDGVGIRFYLLQKKLHQCLIWSQLCQTMYTRTLCSGLWYITFFVKGEICRLFLKCYQFQLPCHTTTYIHVHIKIVYEHWQRKCCLSLFVHVTYCIMWSNM